MRRLCVLALAAFAVPIALPAQAPLQVATIHIRVLKGRNDRPVRRAGTSTSVLPLQPYATPIPRTTDRAGTFSLLVQTDAEVRVAVAKYAACRTVAKADRKKPLPAYSVEQILASGVVTENRCSQHTVAPTPGELILFVHPTHWWTRLHY